MPDDDEWKNEVLPLFVQSQRVETRASTARWINWYMGTHMTPDEIDAAIPPDTQDMLIELALNLSRTSGRAP